MSDTSGSDQSADAGYRTLVVTGAVARTIEVPRSDVAVEDLLATACADPAATGAVVHHRGGAVQTLLLLDEVSRGRLVEGALVWDAAGTATFDDVVAIEVR